MKRFLLLTLALFQLTACEKKLGDVHINVRDAEAEVADGMLQPEVKREIQEVSHEAQLVSSALTFERPAYTVGQIPEARVSLLNMSNKELVLPRGLDGSEAGWRYPHCGFEVFDENKKPVELHGVGRCGNMDTLKLDDFVRLGAGQSLDLCENGYAGFSALYQISMRPGTYWVRHYYVTSGGPVEDYFGDERRMKHPKIDPEIRALAGKIPKVRVYSEMVKVVIQPKAAE